ncbi:unnamed protein product [Alternaria alternata]|jgi:hypothetical protein|uniref:Uncharacterized protein n=1 Tax=Alternaria alternata TaxID=5599 RepID=A0A177DYY3_ALTAL|nr:hypothetical protein CC77DRAFT_1006190 [Alternaria alternata]RYN69879.1 hypothetical protein AA0118_g567 [Alternaria tenuissima]KAH6859204.1 hypothetical protein B0T12DRAFT_407730 [Alternaria alternata]OAG23989.1 hypothetical protein CC77DRAFT_1006190 [Alternaria alternata]OWY57734.1 hypothetical protein AALT_g4885 [Alternaria alternata]RYN84408.1 hypothetical protein AA0117_g466 [Alternaria alternata]
MATDMLEAEPFQAIEDQHLDSAPEVQTPLTKSGVAPIKNPEAAEARFRKGDLVRKKASASSGAQTKAAYSIYASRNSPHGWVEYQLKDFYTHKVDGTWTREKDLKAGA